MRQQTHGPTPVASRRLAAGQSDQRLFSLPWDGHFVWPLSGPPRIEGRLKTVFHELLPYTVDGRKTYTQRLGDGFVGIPHAFWTRLRLQQNAAMEQCASDPLPDDTIFRSTQRSSSVRVTRNLAMGELLLLKPQSVARRRTDLAQPVNRSLPSY
jgi:hypothetical protein